MSEIKLNYGVKISLTYKNQFYDLDVALELLNQIQQKGNLRAAAKQCGYSYRKAWNILKQLEDIFDLPLVEKQQGKGSQLSPLGKSLLNNSDENKGLLYEPLKKAEDHANTIISTVLPKQQITRIIASDSVKLEGLRQQYLAMELHVDGSGQALSAYAEGKCELAGFHIGMGEMNQQQLEKYCHYLDPRNDLFILLEQRQQGLVSHPENPVNSLQQLLDQQLVFVNRQQGSGTRLLLDNMLKRQSIKVNQLQGYFHEEHTHLAVASMVMSRQADAGIAIKSVANRLNLHFTAVCDELYFLVFKSSSPEIQFILNKLTKPESPEILSYKEFVTLLVEKNM